MQESTPAPKTTVTPAPAGYTEAYAVSQVDNRPGAGQAVAFQQALASSPRLIAQRQAVAAINSSPRQVAQRQAAAAVEHSPRQVAQRQAVPNRTGLPDQLKAGVENLSGHSLDDVRVHYNSAKPAQLQAHAYAQGAEIHVAPGQEKHLPHEAWHVAQQKQGRVRATTQLKGVGVNDDSGLEKEADVMGARAVSGGGEAAQNLESVSLHNHIVQRVGKQTIEQELEAVAETCNDDDFQNLFLRKDSAKENILSRLTEENKSKLEELSLPLISNFVGERGMFGRLSRYVLNSIRKNIETIYISEDKEKIDAIDRPETDEEKGKKKKGDHFKASLEAAEGYAKATLVDPERLRIGRDLVPQKIFYATDRGKYSVVPVGGLDAEEPFSINIKEAYYEKGSSVFSLAMRASPSTLFKKDDIEKLGKNINDYFEVTKQTYNDIINISIPLSPAESKAPSGFYAEKSLGHETEDNLKKIFKESKEDGSHFKSARNYSHYNHPQRGKKPWTDSAKEAVGSQEAYEWCHLIGHGDGGGEDIANFVAGTKAVNTEQLGIEQAVRSKREKFAEHGVKIVLVVKALLKNISENDNNANDRNFIIANHNVARAIRYKVAIGEESDKGLKYKTIYTKYMDAERKHINIAEVKELSQELSVTLDNFYDKYVIGKPVKGEMQKMGVQPSVLNDFFQEDIPNKTKKYSEKPIKDQHVIGNKGQEYPDSYTDKNKSVKPAIARIDKLLEEPIEKKEGGPQIYNIKLDFLNPPLFLSAERGKFMNELSFALGGGTYDSSSGKTVHGYVLLITNQVSENKYSMTWTNLEERLKHLGGNKTVAGKKKRKNVKAGNAYNYLIGFKNIYKDDSSDQNDVNNNASSKDEINIKQ